MATDNAKQPIVEILDEDDEFEEFPQENWNASLEDHAEQQQWQEDWDDDDVDDDFCAQLRAELQSSG